MCRVLLCTKFGEFLPLFLELFFALFFFFLDSYYIYVHMFNGVPQISEVLFISLHISLQIG